MSEGLSPDMRHFLLGREFVRFLTPTHRKAHTRLSGLDTNPQKAYLNIR